MLLLPLYLTMFKTLCIIYSSSSLVYLVELLLFPVVYQFFKSFRTARSIMSFLKGDQTLRQSLLYSPPAILLPPHLQMLQGRGCTKTFLRGRGQYTPSFVEAAISTLGLLHPDKTNRQIWAYFCYYALFLFFFFVCLIGLF